MGILPVTDKIAVMRDGMVSAFGDSEKIFDAFLRVPAKTGP
jgi:ATP-binding cassette subfamily C protein